jgi:hypothetical protein
MMQGMMESVPSSFALSNGGVDMERRRSLEALHAPQPVCNGAEVELHDADHELVPVMLRHGAPIVVDDSDKAEQQDARGADTVGQLPPLVAKEVLALQGAAPEGAAGQHSADQPQNSSYKEHILNAAVL